MLQRLRRDLTTYHGLFSGDRCKGWELEELIVAAITSDTQAQHHVRWKEAGHDDAHDIDIRTNGETHAIQIKSGKIQGGRTTPQKLMLSGHRLGRFAGDLEEITDYLNAKSANIITVPYRKTESEQGRQHIYQVCYIDVKHLTGLRAGEWAERGKQYVQTNADGVEFSLRPSMSWQVWWAVPVDLIESTGEFAIV